MRQKRNIFVLFLVLLFLLVVGILAFMLFNRNTQDQSSPPPIQSDSSSIRSRFGAESGVVNIKDNENTLVAYLNDVTNQNSLGMGFVLRENEHLYHEVEAVLPPLEGNNFYEGWLVQQEPELKFISTGIMDHEASGNFSIIFESETQYEGYNFVVITLETTKDGTPEKHVLEGLAK
jgi:hypothetical protein